MIASINDTAQKYLTLVNETNLIEFSLLLGTFGETYDGSDVKWAYTNEPILNLIVDPRFPREEADQRISALIERFEGKGVRPSWIVGPSSRPSDIFDRLEEHGYNRASRPGMAADLNDLPERIDPPAGYRIQEVTDLETLKTWGEVVCKSLDVPEPQSRSFQDLFARLGVCNAIPWKHYLGFLDGEPSSACTVFEGSGVHGIYAMTVVPECRRRGIGYSMLWNVLNEVRNEGHRYAVLQTTPQSISFCERLGFVEHCEMTYYAPINTLNKKPV